MQTSPKKAVIIGETNLCTQCAKYLLDNKWKIIFMVSDDRVVVTWAKDNAIAVLPTAQLNTIKETDFYLFSIINPYLIPKAFLDNSNVLLALNYHDSFLPKYAGINSTTWAIINNEKRYGVTLHKIEPSVDEGAIVAQSTVSIEEDETAISLNLKCSEHLLSLFKEVLTKIENGTLRFFKQNLTDRTYYGLKNIPANYGIINGTKDVETLHRLVRGLTFGDGYDNPVATVKIRLKDSFYIVEDFNTNVLKKNILAKSTVLFNQVRDVYGNKIDLKVKYHDILTKFSLAKADIQYLSDTKSQERKHKKQILRFLKDHSDASLMVLDRTSDKLGNHCYTKKINTPDNISTTTLLTLVCFILARFFRDNFIVSLYLANEKISSPLRNLIDNRNFIYVHQDILNNSFTDLEDHLNQLQNNYYTLTKDFSYRYQLQLLTDIAITTGKVTSTDNHRIVIKIKDKKIEVQGDVSCQLQMESIATAITTMLAKNIKKEIAAKELKHINLLNQDQYQQIVYEWNKTEWDYPHDKTTHQLFEEQVLKTPDSFAVVCKDKKLTYKELNQKANQLATYLQTNYKIKPDDLMVLCLDRSEYMIIAMLGILKAGGAYVPIEPGYPDKRINYILNDTKTKVVLTSNVHKDRLQQIAKQKREKQKKIDVIALESKEIQDKLSKQENISPTTATKSTSLVYVIYTSGTTGNPKGVMIEHRGVVSLVKNINYIKININNSFIQFSALGFDAATFEIWAPLLNGAKLVVPDSKIDLFGDAKLFYEVLIKNKVTVLWLTKTLFDQIFLANAKVFKDLKYLLVGGEALDRQLIARLIDSNYSPKNVINGYGPTENTSFSTTLNITQKSIANVNTVPIGVPFANRKAYVLDAHLNVLPIGVVGELCVTGAGIARGYLNRPDLTMERFIDNPFQTPDEKLRNINSKLYKTGDLTRLLSNGNIEYLGRNDAQVKIRGFRIELGEIENSLLSYPQIRQAAVIVKENKNHKILVAYYSAVNKPNEINLRNYISSQLPDYMVPNVFVYMQHLPLTDSGKLNRRALPEPTFTNLSEYLAPRNELEKKICKIYAQVLNLPIEQVGITSDFFRMGGDSISSIQIVSQIRQQLDLSINVSDIFNQKTVEQLVTNVLLARQSTAKGRDTKKIKREDRPTGFVNLLPIQKWFFENVRSGLYPKYNHWNQSFIIKTPELNLKILKLSIKKLLEYHDSFRLIYNGFQQNYSEVKKLEGIKKIDVSKFTNEELEKKLTEIQSHFDIENGPIYTIAYLQGYKDKTARLFFAFHHLIVDSVSWRILTEDMAKLYQLLLDKSNNNKTSQELLGSKGTSYKQWAEEIKNYKPSQEEINYWQDILRDYVCVPIANKQKASEVFSLTSQLTQELLTKSNATYHTQANDLLLAALARTLAQIFNRQINHIAFEGHGREEINPKIDITRTVGWFTTMYPVRLVNYSTVSDLIKATKENLRNVPNKGIGYGAIKGYKNLPTISFNYLGQLDDKKDFWTIENHLISRDSQNQNNSVLDVFGYITNGVLNFHIECNGQSPSAAHAFSNQFKSNLIEIIEHCSSNSRTYLTVSDVNKVIDQVFLDKIQEKTEIEDIYLANNLQQGLIYHAIRRTKTDNAYLSQFVWNYKILINEDKFKKAWQLAQKKYPSLRLRFAWDNEIVQIIDGYQELDFRSIDLTCLFEKEHQTQIAKIIEKDRQEYYDLRKGNLIRIYLIKSSKSDYTCICSIHHIILDGWSMPLLVNSVHEVYSQLLVEQKPQIIKETIYRETQKYLTKHQDEDQVYWSNYIKQIKDRVDLRSLLKPSAQNIEITNYFQVEQEQEQSLEITGSKLIKLKDICQAHAITINAVIQYVWHRLLHLYGDSNTTVVGTVVSGRNIPVDGIENSLGFFLNTLPLIFVHDDKTTLIEQLKIIQNSINEVNSKSNVNLAKLSLEGRRLFDSLLVYENMPTPKTATSIRYGDIREIFKVDYPLAIIVYEKEERLTIILKYAGELFDQVTILQLLNSLIFFIEQIVENPYKKNLNYLNQKEYQQLILDHNKTAKDYPANKSIHQLFAEQVLKTPNNIAVVYQNRKLSYKELDRKANQLASYLLINNKIKPDNVIAIMLDRSEYTVISILAVLKTGAAYVPIDPSYPKERIKYILKDTQVKIVIKNSKTNYKMPNVKIIDIDSNKVQRALLKEGTSDPKINVFSTHLIYVLYTSGTTGKPKGIMLEHAGCVNRILEMIRISCITEHDRILFKTNYMFDVSFSDIFTTLLAGASLFITKECFDIEEICSKIKQYSINICHFTPSQFEVLKDIKGIDIFKSFKTLHFSGEALDTKILMGLNKGIKCINYYGPTEAGEVTYDLCSEPIGSQPVIGYPIKNVKVFVLDKNLIPLPIGAIGELYLSGVCLARGYLNQPNFTREKFIANLLQTPEEKRKNINSKLYKTGDLVRILPNKNIEYIGRTDFQVKIRGYRIELGEIENKLMSYPKIKQAVVVVSEKSNNQYLIAYYVADKKSDEKKIKYFLSKQLPNYMIPSIFIYMPKLPLTENGKLDRAILPEPKFAGKSRRIVPKNEQEHLICVAFSKVLGLKNIGVNDDFFSIGGNSIQAIKLVSILQLNFDIKIADIFNLRTPKKLARNSIFGKNFLQHRLEQVKLIYKKKQSDQDVEARLQKLDEYLKPIESLQMDLSLQKPIHNVLLTGSTGFLGCNVLDQLLEMTTYNIYLPIRANSQSEAIERINEQYRFYFDKTLDDVIGLRVFVLKADLEQSYLGLSQSEYKNLTTKIDSIIHVAALVKYYGEYSKSYSANVGATINLLEFTKLTKLKDFHYISTIGVLRGAKGALSKKILGIEDDLPEESEVFNHVYVQTKLLGEHQVIKYRDFGLNCNIYRVGNLTFILKNYRVPKNAEDNSFYSWLKCIFAIKCSTKIINFVEISPPDLTAQAIVKLFDKQSLNNRTYHVFNPYQFDMTNVLKNKNFKMLPIEKFIDFIAQHIKKGSYYDLIVKFLLHIGWLDYWEKHDDLYYMQFLQQHKTQCVLQQRTQYILKELDFKWPLITINMISNYLKYFEKE